MAKFPIHIPRQAIFCLLSVDVYLLETSKLLEQDFSILKLERKTIKMNSDYFSSLEVVKHPLHDHLISTYHEPEASGLQVVSLAQPEQLATKNKAYRMCRLRKSTFWLSLALRGYSCRGRNSYQRYRLFSCQIEIWSQRKVRNAGFECDIISSLAKGIQTSRYNLQASVSSRSNALAGISSSTRASSGRDSSTAVVAIETATSTSSIGNGDLTILRSAARSETANTTYSIYASAKSAYPTSTSVHRTSASLNLASSSPSHCPSLKSPYTPPAVANSGQFDIACQTDFDLPHFQQLTTKRFIECIAECARHNLSQLVELQGSCAVASFMASGFDGITCWLKSSDSPSQGRTTVKVSSAVATSG